MHCWGELKSLQRKVLVRSVPTSCILVMPAIFMICGNESKPDLQLVKKLTAPLAYKGVL